MGTACHGPDPAPGPGRGDVVTAIALPVVTNATDDLRVLPGTEPAVAATAGSGPTVEVGLLRLDPDLPAPSYARPGDAGADLRTREDVVLQPGQRRVVPTGVAIALPDGFVGLVHPRSGLAARYGLTVVNAPGTVDSGYRGEIMVTLLNTDPGEPIVLRRGDRIAQLVVQRVEHARFVAVEALPDSVRGAGGLGSTGGFTGGSIGADPASGRSGPVAEHAGYETGDCPGRGESS
jgi:dUTP pyrophosphatase